MVCCSQGTLLAQQLRLCGGCTLLWSQLLMQQHTVGSVTLPDLVGASRLVSKPSCKWCKSGSLLGHRVPSGALQPPAHPHSPGTGQADETGTIPAARHSQSRCRRLPSHWQPTQDPPSPGPNSCCSALPVRHDSHEPAAVIHPSGLQCLGPGGPWRQPGLLYCRDDRQSAACCRHTTQWQAQAHGHLLPASSLSTPPRTCLSPAGAGSPSHRRGQQPRWAALVAAASVGSTGACRPGARGDPIMP
jgi:hypothetical protein